MVSVKCRVNYHVPPEWDKMLSFYQVMLLSSAGCASYRFLYDDVHFLFQEVFLKEVIPLSFYSLFIGFVAM